MADKKLMLLTGGNSGIGLKACKILCARGHKVVATVRSDEKGAHCISEVKAKVPDADIHYMIAEMSDVSSVKKLAEDFTSTWLANDALLDVLINNAGCLFQSGGRRTCPTNPEWEQTFATNTIGPILLTDLLIDNLKQTAAKKGEARVVMVNSSVINADKMVPYQPDFDDLMIAKEGKYTGGLQAYKISKLGLMMASLAMVEELKGTGVTLNSLCPGVIGGTNIFTSNVAESEKCGLRCQLCCMVCFFCGQSQARGGNYIVQVADEERGKSQGIFFYRGDMTSPSPFCADTTKQKKMLQIIRDFVN